MARIQQSSAPNLPSDGKLGFRSGLLLNWRDNPNIVPFRQFTINAIQMHLAQKTSGDLRTAVPQLALIMEDQIFRDAVSQEDYMDQEKLFDRVGALIVQKWYDQQKAMQKTNLLTMYTSAPAVQTTRCDFGTSLNSNLRDNPMSADIGVNMVCPDNMSRPYLSATAVKSGFHGSRKRSFDATLQHPEWMLLKVCSPREGFTCGDPVDSSGPTFSGSVLQYDSEASFESHRSNSQFQSEGDLNIIMSSNSSSPSVQTPSIIGESYDGCLGTPKSFGGRLCQNKNSYAVQDAMARPLPLSSYHGFSQHSFDDVQRRSVDKLLSSYILYNKNCVERKIPFLEFWHSRNCGGGICSCENNRMVLSHFDTCGSSDCVVCAPAVRTHGTEAGNTVCYKVSEDLMIPIKYRKLDSSSVRCGSSYDVDSIGLSGRLNVDPENPVMATSDSPEATMEMACHADGPMRIGQAGNSVVDVVLGSNSDDVSGPGEVMTAVKPESPHELKDMGSDGFSKLLPDPAPSLCEELKTFQGQEVITTNDPEIVEPKEAESSSSVATLTVQGQEVITINDPEIIEPKEEDSSSSAATLTEMKVEKQKVDGISLIDFFTEEEIRQHMSGLRKKVDQVIADETVRNTATCSVSENFCQLCALDRLSFPPMPIFCSACAARVKNSQSYYSTKDDRAQFCFCTQCYYKSRGGIISFLGFSIAKNNLELRKNNLVTEESWVQCDKCEGWQHQICALFNDKRDLGGKVEYICPKCHLEDLATAEGRISRTTSFDASNLPRTLLSNHLEERLVRRLNEEREERAKAAGKNPEEVPQPADLVVRVVSSVDKMLKVKQQFLDIFPEKNYPAEFPYRSKVILLFQRIEGVDVCLFAMYVQEYGSECSLPNQRCVYISYLDSVKYFRPEAKTVKGEALRTFVYHEILVGYLDYCKKRGFVTCYIWACPPVKGEDYILYCHPETQKTPRPDKLRLWYQTMLKKATEQKIVVSFSNLYEKFFVPNGESNTKVTAARLPYLEGDYWSSIVESIIKKIEAESGGDLEKQIKKMTRRSLKAMGHTNPSACEAKDILLMQALAQSISSAKEDFIIVYLQSVCTQCHEVMLSGKRWSCNQCKNYELCERCHDKEEYSGEGATHVSSSGQKHTLHQDMVEDVAIDTEDNDAIMANCFLENRHSFLNFCQGNHYQFDSLRRAKHSSMMILYHLHNPNESVIGVSCSLCLKYIGSDPKWTCEMCPDFCACSICHQRNNSSCHVHTLIRDPPFARAGNKVAEMVRELLNVVLHASRCQTIPGYSCSFPRCTLLRRLFSHAQACSIRARGGCQYCKKTWFVLVLHSRRCKDSNCPVPRCRDLKEHALRLKKKSETKPLKQLPDASGQPIL